ncbi:dihydrodipicolinate synthase family protein [Paenibacillus antri]|uniref:Dihydrodipicolinate synthase family protein n=1 Tax=Paenibacillus antri TaxID=2582848 RepID=A0A5R9G269_9BACL|nr:dihydrodipicolinate synthase family protein [Paenibacillus antri]TLS49119.1 dihydrodipicolinate synthase family protein [Paenibacillus antri]
MTIQETKLLQGVYPILATCFGADDEIDYDSQRSLIEFCIEGGVHGLVLMANASEGHLLSDQEKRDLLVFCMETIAGRVPVIVTVNHPSAKAAAEFARFAETNGAAAVMAMPPFFGRWRAGPDEISRFFGALNDAVTIPIVVQDHVLSDIQLPVSYLVDLAKKWPRVRYMKLESGNINYKAQQLLKAEGQPFLGIFGGNSGIFMPEEMESGCTGTMPACYMPEVFRATWDLMQEGRAEEAVAYFTPFSRLAAYEKDVANRCVWKEILVKRGVIAGNDVRQPKPSFAGDWQYDQLMRVAERAGLVAPSRQEA